MSLKSNKFFILLLLVKFAFFALAQTERPIRYDFLIENSTEIILRYLHMIERKLKTNSLTNKEEEFFQILMKIIVKRFLELNDQRRRENTVYWYSRQGRNVKY